MMYRLNPQLHVALDAHQLSDGKTVLTHRPTKLTKAQAKEVLESEYQGVPLAVEVEADEAEATEAAEEQPEEGEDAAD